MEDGDNRLAIPLDFIRVLCELASTASDLVDSLITQDRIAVNAREVAICIRDLENIAMELKDERLGQHHLNLADLAEEFREAWTRAELQDGEMLILHRDKSD